MVFVKGNATIVHYSLNKKNCTYMSSGKSYILYIDHTYLEFGVRVDQSTENSKNYKMIETFAMLWHESVIIFCIDSSMHYTVYKCTVYTSIVRGIRIFNMVPRLLLFVKLLLLSREELCSEPI